MGRKQKELRRLSLDHAGASTMSGPSDEEGEGDQAALTSMSSNDSLESSLLRSACSWH